MTPETRVYHMRNIACEHNQIRHCHCRPVLVERCAAVRPVRTKADFYRRFYAGEFGNHGPMWSSLEQWRASGYAGTIAIRSLRKGGPCTYDIRPHEVDSWTLQYVEQMGHAPHEMNWSAMAPTERTVVQGEIMRGVRGLEAFVSTVREPMRRALSTGGRTLLGASAVVAIRDAMDGASWEWLNCLLDTYDNHVVEFSTFERPWGVIPGMNTVIWEVRAY